MKKYQINVYNKNTKIKKNIHSSYNMRFKSKNFEKKSWPP